MTDGSSDWSSPEQRAQLGAVGAATGLGCSVVVGLIVFIGGGVLLDQAVDSAPLFTLLGVLLGLVAAGYQLWELTRIGVKDRPAGPLGRRLSSLSGSRAARRPADETRSSGRERGEE